MKKEIKEIEKEIEKKFLTIRGFTNWKKYDNVRNSLEIDINAREELINLVIRVISKQFQKEIKEIQEELKGKINMITENGVINPIIMRGAIDKTFKNKEIRVNEK